MKKLAIAVVAILQITAAYADNPGNHLEPVGSQMGNRFGDYAIAATVFKEAFASDVVLRVWSSGGMQTDDMTFIKKEGGKFKIVNLHSAVSLSRYSDGASADFGRPKDLVDYRKLKPSRCQVEIPEGIALRIADGWRRTLLRTRYDAEPRRGLDGGWFYFAVPEDQKVLEGRTWSPDDDTEAGRLVSLARRMQDVCSANSKSHRFELTESADELLNRLK